MPHAKTKPGEVIVRVANPTHKGKTMARKRKKNPSKARRRKNPSKARRRRNPAPVAHASSHHRRRRRKKNPFGLNLSSLPKILMGAAAGVGAGIALSKIAEKYPSAMGQAGVLAAGTVASLVVGGMNPLAGAAIMTPVLARAASRVLPAGFKTSGIETFEDSWSGIPYQLGAVEADLGAVEADLGYVSDGYLGEMDLSDRRQALMDAFY